MSIQWSLVLFTVVAGAGAWQFAWAVAQRLARRGEMPGRLEAAIALALLVAGGLIAVTHLGRADRILEALNRPESGIFAEAVLIIAQGVLIGAYLVMMGRGSSERARMGVAIAAAVVGVAFTFVCGSSYSVGSRPAWATVALPLAYCGTAAAAGAGVNLLVKALVCREGGQAATFAGVLAAAAAVLGAVCSAAFLVHAGTWLAVAPNASAWAAVCAAGLAVAALAGLVAGLGRMPAVAAGVFAIGGGVAAALGLRVVMWLVGMPVMNLFQMPIG